MARLLTLIESNHAVTSEQIAIARGQRNRLFDVTAALSIVPLYFVGATVACRHLCRRFSSDHRSVRLVATVSLPSPRIFSDFKWANSG